MSDSLEIRSFNIREADWAVDGGQLSRIRKSVFIIEQNVPQEEEWDGKDEDAWHWLATNSEDHPIGTSRLLPDGQIGRMAVLSEYRGHQVGAALLEAAVEKARHLGMTSVFLNAQTHALGFYERLGFIPEGEEFDEAGIPHFRMTQALQPPDDNIQRRENLAGDVSMSVKPFDTFDTRWDESASVIQRIRRQVFRTELGYSSVWEADNHDETALHWIAENDDGHPVGVIRMDETGNISHLAVLDDFRHQGIGLSLVELAIQRARRFQLEKVCLYATPASLPFFLAAGMSATGETDTIGGEQCQIMSFTLIEEEPDERDPHGESLDSEVAYRLGKDKQLLLLRSESDFRNVIVEMAKQARQSLRIYSPVLSHDLFDNTEMLDICSNLARRNKYTRIEILVFDPHRVIKNGHSLLNIARRLPSSIGIKIVDPEMRQQFHEYMLVDNEGVVYRQEYETYEGTACFYDVPQCNRLGRQFTASWESGLLDPNLRQLRI